MPVVLETERAFLREMLLNDVEPVAALTGDPSQERARAWVRSQQESYRLHGFGVWSVIHRESGTFLGQAGFRLREGECELYCEIDPRHRGLGLGKEIAARLRDHAFSHLGRPRVVSHVPAGDDAARKTAEGIGMALVNESSVADQGRLLFALDR